MDEVDRGAATSRWVAVSAAMRAFVNAPLSAGLGTGLGFFPRNSASGGEMCAPADYAFPVVPLGILHGVAPSILTAISAQSLGTGTPTTPALQGALRYARTRQIAQAARTVAVVLVTDGEPRGCSSTVQSASMAAAQAAAGTPPVKTYVLGVGPSLTNLNAIAEAGGTTHAYLVERAGETSLTAALDAIRTSALTCSYVIPVARRRIIDLALTQVQVRVGPDGSPVSVRQVASAEACGAGDGWFYDKPLARGEPPPTMITLCSSSCDPMFKTTGSHLDALIGCAATTN